MIEFSLINTFLPLNRRLRSTYRLALIEETLECSKNFRISSVLKLSFHERCKATQMYGIGDGLVYKILRKERVCGETKKEKF